MTDNFALPQVNTDLPSRQRCEYVSVLAADDRVQPAASVQHEVALAIHQIGPDQVKYIKLGPAGIWAKNAIRDGILPFGYGPVAHDACVAGDWDTVRLQIGEMGFSAGSSRTKGLREIREFYQGTADTLWITMANGHFWWAFAEETVFVNTTTTNDDPPRYRQTRSGWSKLTLDGKPLTVSSLSSALTKTANYRMTICDVEHAQYLLRRIRGDQDPVHRAATAIQNEMSRVALEMIDRLDWRDFETLVDLTFARGGWQRTSELGKGQADVDLILSQPITGETAWVQIKSTADQRQLNDYLERFKNDGSCDRFFFISHKARGHLSAIIKQTASRHNVHIWTSEKVADATIAAGLFDWLKQRT